MHKNINFPGIETISNKVLYAKCFFSFFLSPSDDKKRSKVFSIRVGMTAKMVRKYREKN